MPSLAETQAAIAAALTDPGLPAPPEVRRPGDVASPTAHTKRFDVYRNNVAVAAIDALCDIYPAVQTLVGEDFLQATARVYFEQTRPVSPLLFRYGADFGDFLDTFPPAASVPYLGDVARLEFARLRAYHAADAAPVGIAALSDVPADQVAFVHLAAHPSVSLIRSRFPVVSLWGASSGLMNSDDVDMQRAEDALVIRPGLEVECHILPPGGGVFLEALLAGRQLGDAAAQSAEATANFDLSTHLAGLFEMGAFVGILTGTGTPADQPVF